MVHGIPLNYNILFIPNVREGLRMIALNSNIELWNVISEKKKICE